MRTDAHITQMMDCRSPDASQCFNMPSGSRWAAGREALPPPRAVPRSSHGTLEPLAHMTGRVERRRQGRAGQDARHPPPPPPAGACACACLTCWAPLPGIRGCANLPDDNWSDLMSGPLPYVDGVCPVAFDPSQATGHRQCKRCASIARLTAATQRSVAVRPRQSRSRAPSPSRGERLPRTTQPSKPRRTAGTRTPTCVPRCSRGRASTAYSATLETATRRSPSAQREPNSQSPGPARALLTRR